MTERSQSKIFPRSFVAALLLGAALNPINDTLISTALVPIANSFAISVGRTAVLVSAPYLACAVAQPTAGKLAEQLGPRKTFLSGVVLVLCGGVIGGLAQNLAVLVCARVIIGLGTSCAYPSAMLMVRRRSSDAGLSAPPGAILGALAVVGLTFIAIGPPIGGVVVSLLGWRAIFLLNIPFALLTLVLILIGIPADRPLLHRSLRSVVADIDLVGIVGFALTTTALLSFLLSIPNVHWSALCAAIFIGAVFVLWELRVDRPFFDVRELVTNIPLTLTYLRVTCGMLGAFVVLYGLPQWLEAAHGYSADLAGLTILPMGIISALISTWVSARGWIRGPLVAAGLASVVGGLGMLTLGSNGLPLTALATAAVFGVTLGATQSGAQLALFVQASPQNVGTAAGLLRTFNYLGSIAASVISGIVFRNSVTDGGMHEIGLIVTALGLVVLIMTVADRSLRAPRHS